MTHETAPMPLEDVPDELFRLFDEASLKAAHAVTSSSPIAGEDAYIRGGLAAVVPVVQAEAEATITRLADVLVILMGAHRNTEPHRNLDRRGCQGCQMFRELLAEPAIVAAEKRHKQAVLAALRDGSAAGCRLVEERDGHR